MRAIPTDERDGTTVSRWLSICGDLVYKTVVEGVVVRPDSVHLVLAALSGDLLRRSGKPRGRLLMAAVGFAGCALPSYDRALWALRAWLDSWPGIGHAAGGMARQGYDLQLTRYDEKGWRATFYTTGMEHSPTSATGTAWERTPWQATQRAAWEAFDARRGDT
jgi:hypothetical protein